MNWMNAAVPMLFFFLSNLGDGKVQSCVDDESEEQEEKGKNAQQGLLKHDDPRKRITQLKINDAKH